MRFPILYACCVVLAGCVPARRKPSPPPPTPTSSPPVVLVIRGDVDESDLEAAVGKWVRVEGVVSDTKQPQIAGIDIDLPETIPGSTSGRRIDLWRQPAWAEGVLKRTVVRPEQVDNRTANRGAGVFFRLVDPATSHTVVAHPAERGS